MKKDDSSALSVGNKTWQHPELREGEAFLGNTKKNEFFSTLKKWKSKRMGRIAYDINEEEIVQLKNTSKLVPVFVSQAEVERRRQRADRYGSRKRYKKH